MIKKVERASIICWSPESYMDPMLALGTVAGALDESFSSKSDLELFSLDLANTGSDLKKIGSVACNARFNRISWGPELIACGKENGEIDLYDPSKIISSADKPMTYRASNHTGPVRGLHFNPLDTHLLASGALDGEILIWDMNQLNKPYAPGARSQRLEDVTYLTWNKKVPHILASGSSNGYTVVWDLRNRKELIKIPNPAGRKTVTSIAWNPDNPTQMVTCYDDDSNPVILVWDLRNASAAEKSLSGHSKGILSMDWCSKDSDLLLSCGKDNRTIVWDTSTGEPIGDLLHSANWTFDTHWCPRNPDLCAVASYDGVVSVHSLQGHDIYEETDAFTSQPLPDLIDHNDPFAGVGVQEYHPRSLIQPLFKLSKPPKWLRKPVGAVWGFGGALMIFDASKPSVLTIKHIPINEEISLRTDQLEFILGEENQDTIAQYCDYMAHADFVHDKDEQDVWKFLRTKFSSNISSEMMDLLAFDPTFANDERLSKLIEKIHLDDNELTASDLKVPDPDSTLLSLYSSTISEEADIDKIVTKALVCGNLELAINVCVCADRMADALVIAIEGGPELLRKTQAQLIKRNSPKRPYLRVLKSIISRDLTDIIENTDLEQNDSWREITALICTFSKPEDREQYFSLLGNRLTRLSLGQKSHSASLCYLGSEEFYKVVDCWLPSNHNIGVDHGVLSLVEKISIFRKSICFSDPELNLDFTTEPFKLRNLYNLYVEYAWIAFSNSKLEMAWKYLEMVPIDFVPLQEADVSAGSIKLPIDIFALRDQVYTHKNYTLGKTGVAPSKPYNYVDVFDKESRNQEGSRANPQQPSYPQTPKFYNQGSKHPSPPQIFQSNNNYAHNNVGNNTESNSMPQRKASFSQGNVSQPQIPYSGAYQLPNNNIKNVTNTNMNIKSGNQYVQQLPPPSSNGVVYYNPSQLSDKQGDVYGNYNATAQNNMNIYQNNAPQHSIPYLNQSEAPKIQFPGSNSQARDPNEKSQPYIPTRSYTSNAAKPNAGPPVIQSSTGHAPPIPSAHFQPPAYQPPATGNKFRPNSTNDRTLPPPPIEARISHVVSNDRSQIINPIDKACYESLLRSYLKWSNYCKNPHDKRVYDEAEKKIFILFDQMNNQQVSTQIVVELANICNALDELDFATAQLIEHELMTKQFSATGLWIIGVKRLVDGLERAAQPTLPPTHSTQERFATPSANRYTQPMIEQSFITPPPPISRPQSSTLSRMPTNQQANTPNINVPNGSYPNVLQQSSNMLNTGNIQPKNTNQQLPLNMPLSIPPVGPPMNQSFAYTANHLHNKTPIQENRIEEVTQPIFSNSISPPPVLSNNNFRNVGPPPNGNIGGAPLISRQDGRSNRVPDSSFQNTNNSYGLGVNLHPVTTFSENTNVVQGASGPNSSQYLPQSPYITPNIQQGQRPIPRNGLAPPPVQNNYYNQ